MAERDKPMKKTIGVVVALLLCSRVSWSATVTGVSQTWTYDPVARSGTVHIVNVSHKVITAYSIGLYVTQRDGSTFIAEEKGQEFSLTPFAPGETKDEVQVAPSQTQMDSADLNNPNNIRAEVDVVVYADDTAEVNNQQAFDNIVENRKATLAALKTIDEVVQQTLNDPTVTDHHAAIVAELDRLSVVAKNKNDPIGGFLDVHRSEIPQDEAELSGFIKHNEQRIAELEPHTNLKVVEAVQP